MNVHLRDVSLRDGLQDERPIATDDKVVLFDALVAAGLRDLEMMSFVRPDRVPAMADADELAARTADRDGAVERWALVLNARGAQRAATAGVRRVQFVISVSDTHGRHNAGRTFADAVGELARTVDTAREDGTAVEVTLATAFGCPFEGAIPADDVVAALEEVLSLDVVGASLADTIGTAVPGEVAALVRRANALARPRPIGVHLHDTRGLGVANALAALDAGAARLDASVGGLGGCPFAPGASGNVAMEDLVHVLEAEGVATGIDLDRLIEVARVACGLVGRPVGSHVAVAGPRFADRPRPVET